MDFLGSAAFSQAVQALDIATGGLVCVKIIKNNKVWVLTDVILHFVTQSSYGRLQSHCRKLLSHCHKLLSPRAATHSDGICYIF